MENNYISIGRAASLLGVSITTLRRWDNQGILTADKTPKGHRRYLMSDIAAYTARDENEINQFSHRSTVIYASVTNQSQTNELNSQVKMLETYCISHGWNYEVISDSSSAISYRKKGLTMLIRKILDGNIGRLVVSHKNRFLQFDAELIFSICSTQNVEIFITNQGNDPNIYKQDLAENALESANYFLTKIRNDVNDKNRMQVDEIINAIVDVINSNITCAGENK
jgi:predicted site-specific integrase-resolvase